MPSLETNIPPDQHPEMIPAQEYIQAVREHYRLGEGQYVGRRNEEQIAIAELTADEARAIVDGTMAGILAVVGGVEMPDDYEEVEEAGFTWSKFRNEFERLMVGFGVITHRLHRDGSDIPSYIELDEEERVKTGSALLSDFLAHNALRFGVDSSGVMRVTRSRDEEGNPQLVRSDPDKEKWNPVIRRNMKTRKYSSGVATHAAGKLSPSEYQELRREFPEVDKDDFDNTVGSARNARQTLEDRGQ